DARLRHIRDTQGIRRRSGGAVNSHAGAVPRFVPAGGTGPGTARYGPGGRASGRGALRSTGPMSRRITRLASLHSPEKSLNSAEIEQLQGRILVLEIDKVRLKGSIAADATRRREAETALADSEERYR